MRRKFILTSALSTITMILSITAFAQGEGAHRRTVGLGLQAAPFPIFGPAVTYNPTERFGIQAMGRVGIDVDFAAIRALVKVKHEENHNVYFSGLLGVFRDDNVTEFALDPEQTDTAPGFGIGVGFEYFFSGLPAVGWNIEVDYIYVGFEDKWYEYDYEAFQLIMLGLGASYYF